MAGKKKELLIYLDLKSLIDNNAKVLSFLHICGLARQIEDSCYFCRKPYIKSVNRQPKERLTDYDAFFFFGSSTTINFAGTSGYVSSIHSWISYLKSP